MLIAEIANQCKDKGKVFQKGKLFVIEQNLNQHSDFLTVSWMIHELQHQRKVTFIAFRQNYAHYLSLSKKIGKSIQQYLKSKQLKYYQCFQSSFCQSQFPLTQTSPNSYISPPTLVNKLKIEQIMKKQQLIEENSSVFIDAVSFVQQQNEILFKIYEQGMNKNCKVILAGAMENSKISQVFASQTDLFVKLQADVGNHGKFKLTSENGDLNILWRHVQGKFQLTQYIKL